MTLPYQDRAEAGRVLAEHLGHYRDRADLLVLALPRGGVVVAYEVAAALGAPLDLMLVRKLGHPLQPELAIGAIASGGIRVLRPQGVHEVSAQEIEQVTQREQQELHRREAAYRGDRPPPNVADRCVMLIDDGLATGATMRAAVLAVRQQQPGRVVAAAPVAPAETIRMLSQEADEVVCPAAPESFFGIGQFYRDFTQTSDDEVRDLLARAWSRHAGPKRSDE